MTKPHTPLPWVQRFYINSSEFVVASEQGHVITTVYGSKPEPVANADFIVRACNSHYELVTMLEELYNADTDCLEDSEIESDSILGRVRDVIAKAKGK